MVGVPAADGFLEFAQFPGDRVWCSVAQFDGLSEAAFTDVLSLLTDVERARVLDEAYVTEGDEWAAALTVALGGGRAVAVHLSHVPGASPGDAGFSFEATPVAIAEPGDG